MVWEGGVVGEVLPVPVDGDDAFIRRTYGRAVGRGGVDVAGHPPAAPHLLIRASAGTGKTYQLATRYLRLLHAGETPEHILATTFTRKAAGEILGRVLGWLARSAVDARQRAALDEAIGGFGVDEKDCYAMLGRLVDGLHRLGIGTIDSFFSRAARSLRLELDLPAEPRLVDEAGPLARSLRYDAIHAVLGDAAATDDAFQALIELLRRVHHDTAHRSVTDTIDGLVVGLYEAYRQHPDAGLWSTLDAPPVLSPSMLEEAVRRLEALNDAIPLTKAGKPRANWAKALGAVRAAAQRGDFEAVLTHTLSQRILEGGPDPAYGKHPIPDPWRDAFAPLLGHARALAVRQLAHQTEATYTLLDRFAGHYEQAKRSAGVLMFSDLTHLLASYLPALGEQATAAFYYRLDTRVTHLLLDEFQDTSLPQWRVLRPFAEEVTAVADGGRSFFCVGDEKQAIYGWRGGCAELFGAVEGLPGVAAWTMTQSRRSSPVVLDAVNQVFLALTSNAAFEDEKHGGRWDGAVAQWAERFEPHVAHDTSLPGHVVLRTTAPGGQDADGGADDEAMVSTASPHEDACACHIAGLVAAAPGSTVGVLVRRKKAARGLLHRLRTMGVAVSEEGGNPIDGIPSVSAALAMVQLADHPGDKVAAFHVAHSPLGEVVGLRGVSGPAVTRVALAVRRRLLDRGFGEVLADWCRAAAPSCDARSLRGLEQLVTLAQAHDREAGGADGPAGLRVSGFVQAVRQARVQSPVPAAVRVMTLHAAKGLEFDTVVLPDLGAVLSKTDANALVMIDRDSPLDETRAVVRRAKRDRLKAVGLEALADRDDALQRGEDLCLLYVGMTRAKHALHLLVPPLKPTAKGVSGAGRTDLSYAAVLRQALAAGIEEGTQGGEVLYENGDACWHRSRGGARPPETPPGAVSGDQPTIRLTEPATPRRSRPERRPSEGADASTLCAADLLQRSDPGGRMFGRVMHAACETLGFVDEADGPDPERIRQAVLALGCPAPEQEAARAAARLRTLLDAPRVYSALSCHGAAELWRERAFAVLVGGRLIRGVFDRVHLWRDPAGDATRARLIDFKTDRLGDATLPVLADRYRAQMSVYRDALSGMFGLETQAIEVMLVLTGEAVVIDLCG